MQKPEYAAYTDIRRYMHDLEKWSSYPRCIMRTTESLHLHNILQSPIQSMSHIHGDILYTYEDNSALLEQKNMREFFFPNSVIPAISLSQLAKNILGRQKVPRAWNLIGMGRDAIAPASVYAVQSDGLTIAAKVSTLAVLRRRETMEIVHGLGYEIDRCNRSIIETIPVMMELREAGIRIPEFYSISHFIGDKISTNHICEVQFMEHIIGPTSQEIYSYLYKALRIGNQNRYESLKSEKMLNELVSSYFGGDIRLFGQAFIKSQEELEQKVLQINPFVEDVSSFGAGNTILSGYNEESHTFEYTIVDLAVGSHSGRG